MKFDKIFTYVDTRGEALVEYNVSFDKDILDFVYITFMPTTALEGVNPGVIKIPKKFIEQLRTIPTQVQGVPIEVMINVANAIKKEKEQQSIIIPN